MIPRREAGSRTGESGRLSASSCPLDAPCGHWTRRVRMSASVTSGHGHAPKWRETFYLHAGGGVKRFLTGGGLALRLPMRSNAEQNAWPAFRSLRMASCAVSQHPTRRRLNRWCQPLTKDSLPPSNVSRTKREAVALTCASVTPGDGCILSVRHLGSRILQWLQRFSGGVTARMSFFSGTPT